MGFIRNCWKRFVQNRSALWALRLFTVVGVLCVFCPFLCNERPLILSYEGRLFFPIVAYYPETDFGGGFDIEMDYSDAEFKRDLIKKGWALWPVITYGPHTVDETLSCPAAPSWSHVLGTDDQGRDVLVRLLYGVRTALFFGITLAFCITLIGLLVGGVLGYWGGCVDLIGQRVVEIWSGLPVLFIVMIFSGIVQPTVGWLLCVMVLFSWPALVGLVRAEFLRARRLLYVQAAQVLGARPLSIVTRHILPNALTSALSMFPFLISQSITLLISLDFLGFGLPIGTPSLGELLQQGKQNLFAPWLGTTGFLGMAGILLLITFIGEGLRDAFDTRST